jgi:hypothetical protein
MDEVKILMFGELHGSSEKRHGGGEGRRRLR